MVSAVAVSALLASSSTAAPPTGSYLVTDLGTLGGTTSSAYGINNNGAIVGTAAVAGDAASHAFLYDSQGMHDLGTLPGGTNSAAYAINRYGQVTGQAERLVADWRFCEFEPTCPSLPSARAFRYSEGLMVALGGNPLSTHYYYFPYLSGGYGINDRGDVAGYYLSSSLDIFASYWVGNTLVPLGPNGAATGINDAGEVVGGHAYAGGVWLAKGGVTVDLPDAGGGPTPTAQWGAINNSGDVAYNGRLTFGGPWVALLYSGGTVKELGTFNPYAISQNDLVVGSGGFGAEHAILYRAGKTFDLNDLIDPSSGWLLETARGVNKWGQIVGTGTIGGHQHGFLLTPTRH